MNKLSFSNCGGPIDRSLKSAVRVKLTIDGEPTNYTVTNNCPHYVGQIGTGKETRNHICGISLGKEHCKIVIGMIDEYVKIYKANQKPTLPDGGEGRELE